MAAELTPVETRAQDPTFVAQCSLNGLRDRLPLRWPAPPDTPHSPKKHYRSHYVYPSPGSGQALGWEDADKRHPLEDPTAWEHFSDFDFLLRLLDYTSLRPVLAQLLGWTSARGQVPFDPVSIFLLTGWQITNGWSRAQTLRNRSAELTTKPTQAPLRRLRPTIRLRERHLPHRRRPALLADHHRPKLHQ